MRKYKQFRIVEYKNYFTIEVLTKELCSIGLGRFRAKSKYIEKWREITFEGNLLNIRNCNRALEYKTKEKCLQWIEDYKKYPIYHEV